jgi:RNA polymerase sigma factor (sigma-70 family)
MPTSPVRSLIEHICRAVPPDGDAELLGRFVERRDERALAALVERHGPMVWGVCRRLLSHHDAEDAFQATFIVLVRRAGSVKPRGMVGNWLYGVARQVSLQAKTTVRRRAREIQVPQMPDIEAPQDRWADVRPILDEELSRLPDHYRAVIVLADLEGRSRRDVAVHLGCPEGTVASRLVRARAMLAKRLTGRGIALSGGVLAVALSQNAASAAVPTSVVTSTIKAASLCAAGKAAVSLKVVALTEGVLKTMLLTKLKAAVAVVLVLGVLAIGAIGIGIAKGQQKEPDKKQASETTIKKGDIPQKAEPVQPSEKKVEDVKEKPETKDTIAWGKEVDGLQIGLVADASTYRQGETAKFAVKLRNVGKAEATITYSVLKESPPQVTTADGGKVSVYMPAPFDNFAPPIKRTIKPGETIPLYNAEVAVESEALARLKGIMRVTTPTICVEPGKLKIAYSGMIKSHPKLATGTVEFEVKAAKVSATSWGKEVDGVQVGIKLGEDRVYKVGETLTLIVRLRNNGKKDVPFRYYAEYFQKNPPLITDADGKAVKIKERNIWGIIENSSVAPGKEVDLCILPLDLRPEADRKKGEPWTLYGTGKFHIQYKEVPVVGEVKLGSPGITLATGKLELEVKDAEGKKPVEQKQAFTEWGKEFSGLQAGLGFRPGEQRAYTHGETVTLVVRIRNVGKEEVTFQYVPAFFQETLPTVTHGTGEPVLPIRGLTAPGKTHPATAVTIAPGKEVELYEWNARLAHDPLAGGADDRGVIYVRTGKFSVQYERVLGNSSASRIKIDPALSKLATGKLELEVTEKK